MANKPGEANFFPDVPSYPSMGVFQPVYGKFDLTTYIQGASDYEIMAFLVGKYNACLEAYDKVTKLSTNTITAAHQLQDWINNWFDNLDVQQELNNKINQMVTDGSFETLLHQTFDAQINHQTTNTVTKWLVANVNPTGSAVTVDKSLLIAGSAGDSQQIGYRTNKTALYASPNCSIRYNSTTHIVSLYIPVGSFIFYNTGFLSKGSYSIEITGSYPTGATIYVVWRNNELHFVVNYKDHFKPDDVILWGAFINSEWKLATEIYNVAANYGYYGTYAITSTPDCNIYYTPDTHTVTVDIPTSNFIFYKNGFIPKLTSSITISGTYPSGATVSVVWRNNALAYVVASVSNFYPNDVILWCGFISSSWALIQEVFNAAAKKEETNLLDFNHETYKIFKKIVCCGDSYTEGYIDAGAVHIEPAYSWPTYMAQDSGNIYINCGVSGATTVTWQTSSNGLTKATNAGKTQAYLLGLGLNDRSGNKVPLGTKADIGTNNSTYYAQFSKVVRLLHAISPNAFIFCMTMPTLDTGAYSNAIATIANQYENTYNTCLLELRDYKNYYNSSSVTACYSNYHYVSAGYEQLAKILEIVMSDYINAHADKFKNVHLIEYDK